MPAAAALTLGLAGQAHAQTPFTDWESVLKPGATVAVGGVAQEFTSTAGPSGVTSVAPPSTNMAATFSQTFNAAGEITSMAIQNANRTVGFHRAYGDSISFIANDRLIYGLSSDWTRKAIAADPLEMGWKYQSFGAWVSGLGQPQGSMGAASVGAITAGTSVPQSGSASFTGLMGGIYNDAFGQDHLIMADMGLSVDFGAHRADFWTTNTRETNGKDYRDLNITGVFVSLPAHPALFGSLVTDRLAGTSSAQFYGPAAQEVGGVFTMTPKSGQGLERLAGAFGGTRGQPPAPNRTVSVSGVALDMNAAGGISIGGGSVVQTLTGENARLSLTASGPTQSVTLDRARGDSLGDTVPDFAAWSGDGKAYYRQQTQSYLTFGYWGSGIDTSAIALGALVSGVETPVPAMPTSGDNGATEYGLLGTAMGLYIDPTGEERRFSSGIQLRINYTAKTAELWNYGAFVVDGERLPGTNVFARLSYNGSENRLTGVARTVGSVDALGAYVDGQFTGQFDGRLSGPVEARFYGPRGRNVGGVFGMAPAPGSSSRERIVGAFGLGN